MLSSLDVLHNLGLYVTVQLAPPWVRYPYKYLVFGRDIITQEILLVPVRDEDDFDRVLGTFLHTYGEDCDARGLLREIWTRSAF